MITASLLFAGKQEIGYHHCYYCGALCEEKFQKKNFVKDTFTNRDIIKYPGSNYVCEGCVESLGVGYDEMQMIDGTIKKRENDRGMQPRMYSWVITKSWKRAATKAHIKQLREIILNPPESPFVIVLSDSGQKQLIFRAPMALSRDYFPIMLEDSIIMVDPEILKVRLEIATKLSAAIGKVALMDCNTMQYAIACEKYYGIIEPLENWLLYMDEPLSRLAAWLSKNKEEAQNEYPAIERGTIQTKISGTRRPAKKNGRHRTVGDEGRDHQLYIDFT